MNGSGKNENSHHRSNDRLSNAGMQVMAIQERGENGRARQSSAVLNTLNGGSSSHLENKKEVKDFITKIPGIKSSIRMQQQNRPMLGNAMEQDSRMKEA